MNSYCNCVLVLYFSASVLAWLLLLCINHFSLFFVCSEQLCRMFKLKKLIKVNYQRISHQKPIVTRLPVTNSYSLSYTVQSQSFQTKKGYLESKLDVNIAICILKYVAICILKYVTDMKNMKGHV